MKKKTYFDYMNDKNYAQDMTTGEFVNIKTGKRVKFTLSIKEKIKLGLCGNCRKCFDEGLW